MCGGICKITIVELDTGANSDQPTRDSPGSLPNNLRSFWRGNHSLSGFSMKLEGTIDKRAASSRHVSGRCLCGAVELEIDFPAFWSWHDHSAASRRAHGAAYATFIGCWRKHARVAKGRRSIARFEDAKTESTRSFCSRSRPGASRAGWRLRQSHHRLQQAIAVLSSAGDDSRPHHVS